MTYKLVFVERPKEGPKDAGENVYINEVPSDYKVYAFYYAGTMSNEPLEEKLRELGDITGKNLFVNIGRLSDDHYDKIVARFDAKNYPVIIVTAVDALASPPGEYLSAYARLDSKHLLASPDRTIECVQELFNLFLQGKVAEAVSHAKWEQRTAVVARLSHFWWPALIFSASEKRMYRALILLRLSGSKPELSVYVADSFISYCFYSDLELVTGFYVYSRQGPG